MDVLDTMKLAQRELREFYTDKESEALRVLALNIGEIEAERSKIEWTRVNNDTNGNPRYVCHFLNFIKDNEDISTTNKYAIALTRAKKLGGRKFHNRQYGGGIVFQSYNIADDERRIKEMMNGIK